MDIVASLAPYFERYLVITGLADGRTYDYVKRDLRGLPAVNCEMLAPKCSAGSWLYIAVRAGANLLALGAVS